LEIEEGHRILEIGCVEIIERKISGRRFQQYINPQRDIDDGALEVHGITRTFLSDKPVFRSIWADFLAFVDGAELIIHNAAFDIAFINNEMALMGGDLGKITDYCTIVDSLILAREKFPGQKNSLDALCKRFNVDDSQRDLHGALLDAEILADVYLILTGGQADLGLDVEDIGGPESGGVHLTRLNADRTALRVIKASDEELRMHKEKLVQIEEAAGKESIWDQAGFPA
jgi:DNA polymerase-3 subunit epsilon